MSQTKKALAIVGLAALGVLGPACSGGNAATITLSEFAIKPRGVQLRAGQPATLTLVNGG